MNVRDLLAKKGEKVHTIALSSSILSAVQLMNKMHIGALIVLNEKKEVAGIISERDVLKNIASMSLDDPVKTIMTPADKLLIVNEDDTVDYAMSIFTNNRIRHLPVFRDKTLTGLISIGDTVKGVLIEKQTENKLLQDYITGTYPIYS